MDRDLSEQLIKEEDKFSSFHIVVLGEAGTGKSSICNALFGSKKFKISSDIDEPFDANVNTEPILKENDFYYITDTPGLDNMSKIDEEGKQNIMKKIQQEKEVDNFLLVLNG
jgi:predicted GTPase